MVLVVVVVVVVVMVVLELEPKPKLLLGRVLRRTALHGLAACAGDYPPGGAPPTAAAEWSLMRPWPTIQGPTSEAQDASGANNSSNDNSINNNATAVAAVDVCASAMWVT